MTRYTLAYLPPSEVAVKTLMHLLSTPVQVPGYLFVAGVAVASALMVALMGPFFV